MSEFPFIQSAAQQLIEIGRQFHARGWSLGTSSNFSVVVSHQPLQLLITASGADKGCLQSEDFVLVDADGKVLAAEGKTSSAETMLHIVAAGETDAGAVLHTHSVWATVLSEYFADDGGMRIQGYELLKGLAGIVTHEHSEWLPIYDNTQSIPDLAGTVRQRFRTEPRPPDHGFLIRRHGLYTWGRDVAEAKRHIESLEFLLECVGRSLLFNQAMATPSLGVLPSHSQ